MHRDRYWRNPEKYRKAARAYALAHPEYTRQVQREWYRKTPSIQLLRHAKQRAKNLGLPINLERKDIVIPDFCPVLGIPIKSNVGKSSGNSPTIDRIIPELGYVRGNIRVISHRANLIKNDASPDELRLVAEYAARATAVARWKGLLPPVSQGQAVKVEPLPTAQLSLRW